MHYFSQFLDIAKQLSRKSSSWPYLQLHYAMYPYFCPVQLFRQTLKRTSVDQ